MQSYCAPRDAHGYRLCLSHSGAADVWSSIAFSLASLHFLLYPGRDGPSRRIGPARKPLAWVLIPARQGSPMAAPRAGRALMDNGREQATAQEGPTPAQPLRRQSLHTDLGECREGSALPAGGPGGVPQNPITYLGRAGGKKNAHVPGSGSRGAGPRAADGRLVPHPPSISPLDLLSWAHKSSRPKRLPLISLRPEKGPPPTVNHPNRAPPESQKKHFSQTTPQSKVAFVP